VFRPAEPQTLEQTGLSEAFVQALLCKQLSVSGQATGRSLANSACLPFGIGTRLLDTLRNRKLIAHTSSAHLNDFVYTLTELGQATTQKMLRESAYVGPAPVQLSEYVLSVEAQSIAHETPDRE